MFNFYFIILISATPIEASRGPNTFNCSFKMKKFRHSCRQGSQVSIKWSRLAELIFLYFQRFLLGCTVPQIAMNHARTYEKLHCKVEPYRFSCYRDLLVHRHTQILLLLYGDNITIFVELLILNTIRHNLCTNFLFVGGRGQ